MTVGSEGTGARGDGVAKPSGPDRLSRQHGRDPGGDHVVVRGRQTEPGHRTVQPSRVSRQGEGHSIHDLARLEGPVSNGDAVVERGDRRSSGIHALAVDPHPDVPRLATLVLAQFAHGATLPDTSWTSRAALSLTAARVCRPAL